MKYRLGLWASAGFSIAGCWAIYALATQPPALTSADPLLSLAQITCPIAFASIHFHFGVSLYWCLTANAGTYALIGLVVESVWQRLRVREAV
jgi:predicted acyl esterase